MTPRLFFALLFAVILAAHLCHVNVLWAEENLSLAAAAQMLHGKTLYSEAYFDKPPLWPAVYLLWGARDGWILRLAGSLYVLLASWLAWVFARGLWGIREAYWAAGLLAFFLTFDTHSAVLPLATDLLMMAPHIAAVYLAWKRRPFLSGLLAGVAFLISPKGLLVFAVCAFLDFRSILPLAAGFVVPSAAAAAILAASGALDDYWQQVWVWGRLYAGSTFVSNPLWNGVVRTVNWLGFHAALAVGSISYLARHESRGERRFWLVWLAVSFAGVALGLRFFPRYYFQVLPVLVLMASRGFVLIGKKRAVAIASVLLLAPLIRFGPRYALLAKDVIAGRPHEWSDIAMDRDSREAARLTRDHAGPGDTLFVWGFRPEMYIYTGMTAGTPFLDSQPLTGVPADRHLTQSEPVERDMTRKNRLALSGLRPTFVLDGLSPLNPKLAMDRYPELRPWLENYERIGSTKTYVIYRLAPSPSRGPLLEKR